MSELDYIEAEHQRIDAFKLWCWRRLLKVLWTAQRSIKSILKEIIPEYSLKNWYQSLSTNTLVIWCKEPTHWKRPWCWERLKAKEEKGHRRWLASLIAWYHHDSITDLMDIKRSKLWETVKDKKASMLSPWGYKELDMMQWLNNNNAG